MQYNNITPATFLSRPNRFIAQVELNGQVETVHVKNTGRCRELLIPGSTVYLTAPGTPGRKTTYDLVAVQKDNGLLVNMDSQAPNKVAQEWLATQNYTKILPEYTYGESRIDFYMEGLTPDGQVQPCLMEVKGCTLEIQGVGYFPDAPTERGTKHLRELTKAAQEGYVAYLAFVIQMDGIQQVLPYDVTDPAFAEALRQAQAAGVQILYLLCHVEPDTLTVVEARYKD